LVAFIGFYQYVVTLADRFWDLSIDQLPTALQDVIQVFALVFVVGGISPRLKSEYSDRKIGRAIRFADRDLFKGSLDTFHHNLLRHTFV